MLARVLFPAWPESENQARFCSRRRPARALRWAGLWAGMVFAHSRDQGVEI